MRSSTPFLHGYPRPSDFSRAEIEALAALAQGLPLEQAGMRLGMSARSVRRHARRACDRIGVGTPMEAVVWAAKRGLI